MHPSSSLMEFSGVEGESEKLKAIFLPFITPSHLVPVVDIARIFAMHGVDVTIITTPENAAVFQSSVDRDASRGSSIRTHHVKLPHVPGLPEGVETINLSTSRDTASILFETLTKTLQTQFPQLFHQFKPDFIVSDMFYSWSVDAAAEFGIPRLIYVGGTYFSHCAMDSLERFEPHTKVGSDDESPPIPAREIPETALTATPTIFSREQMNWVKEFRSRKKGATESFASKSFYAFERTYEELYREIMGTKSWNVGPIFSWVNRDASDKSSRGHGKEVEEGWLSWLDSKQKGSVVYVCFGSMKNNFSGTQIAEIAHGLEDCGHDFIWVVGKIDEGQSKALVEEFEKRVEASKKGFLIWGWAPQLRILEHPAVGGVVTHCGMNTVIETVDAGLPMVTWPLFAEQFFNERLLVDVLKVAVEVGAKEWKTWGDFGNEIVGREKIAKAIDLLMGGGEECEEVRRRVKALSEEAKKAIQIGGSSYNSLKDVIQQMKTLKLQKLNPKVEEPVA
uniref:Glycosyltransferase n=1 Tax=Phaseolus vulgaris TaxID=3885 RepID=V5N951_PHAVU|nr:anthocyanidin 3-O-glucosyltransferase [Phaseolus vulgaris]